MWGKSSGICYFLFCIKFSKNVFSLKNLFGDSCILKVKVDAWSTWVLHHTLFIQCDSKSVPRFCIKISQFASCGEIYCLEILLTSSLEIGIKIFLTSTLWRHFISIQPRLALNLWDSPVLSSWVLGSYAYIPQPFAASKTHVDRHI